MSESGAPSPIWPVWLLAVIWGVGPALPTLMTGELLGQPYTDLYPSVWGMWAAAESWPWVVVFTEQLAAPEGMGFYYSSPIKGWLAGLLVSQLGVPATWNLLTVAARVATVGLAGHAARALGLGGPGALLVAAAWGCSAVFQGYAVEGIVEGTDGWTLALWAWAVGRKRWGASALALALTVWSSWYLGAVGCLLVGLYGLRDKRAWLSLLGVLVAAPAVLAFTSAFTGGAPLDPAVRGAMGAPLQVPTPGFSPGLNPFAITAYTGVVLSLIALGSRRWWLLGMAVIPAVLSLGVGPWYELPGLSMLRFPYRWHLATLALLAVAAGLRVDGWTARPWQAWLMGPLIALETLCLSPVEPLIPGAPAEVPAIYDVVDKAVLDVPGPVALPPGEANLSRPRARWFLYAQTAHHQPTPWSPDFNSVGATSSQDASLIDALEEVARFDSVAGGTGEAPLADGTVRALVDAGVGFVVVHRGVSGLRAPTLLRDSLVAQGAELAHRDDRRWLFRLPDRPAGQ